MLYPETYFGLHDLHRLLLLAIITVAISDDRRAQHPNLTTRISFPDRHPMPGLLAPIQMGKGSQSRVCSDRPRLVRFIQAGAVSA